MKILLYILAALLPLHAIIVTTLKCKIGIETNALRFWKEIILIILLIVTFMRLGRQRNWDISSIYKNNYIIWMATAFTICSAIYIIFPFLEWKVSAFLGFKYDVFFIVALVVWLYLTTVKDNLQTILKFIFWSIAWVLVVFLPWYLLWDISTITEIFWFSEQVSTYRANQCIAFSQNVNGEHRFQWSFAWPIRWSVFLTIFYILYIWTLLTTLSTTTSTYLILSKSNGANDNKIETLDTKLWLRNKKFSDISKALIVVPSLFVITSIFYSFSKTSVLGLFFAISLFFYLIFNIKLWKKIPAKVVAGLWLFSILPVIALVIIKKDLFLHLGSVINRFDNLLMSVEMFLYNPIWYGLWIAGPASWTGHDIESAWSWQIAVSSTQSTHKFLPENWYVQIFLEQWIIWWALFIWFVWVIALNLYKIAKKKKDYFSLSVFVAFMTLLFMANFTHAFEESATSFLLFLIIGWHLAQSWYWQYYKKKKKKKNS